MKWKGIVREKAARAAASLILFCTAVCASALEGGDVKELPIGEFDYSIAVPKEWKCEILPGPETLKLHMRVPPSGKLEGHFKVQVLDRGGASPEKWVTHHALENLAASYVKFRVDSLVEVGAGEYRAQLFHVLDIQGLEGYGLLEALVFTECHVIFLGYFYDLLEEPRAREDMISILGSFSSAPEIVEKARLWYEEGCTLGLDGFGLFLRLPEGWIPERKSKKDDVMVHLPSGGSLRVISFMTVSSGLERVQILLRRQVSYLSCEEKLEPVSFGTSGAKAFRFEKEPSKDHQAVVCILGLHGRGGYALILESNDPDEEDLFQKVVAKAVLLDPSEARTLRSGAVDSFKKSVQINDARETKRALSILEIFSGCESTARSIAWGFNACEPIQVECALALGRMGSREASRLLQRALKNRGVGYCAKEACIEALCMIGGPLERDVLEKMDREFRRACDFRLCNKLEEAMK